MDKEAPPRLDPLGTSEAPRPAGSATSPPSPLPRGFPPLVGESQAFSRRLELNARHNINTGQGGRNARSLFAQSGSPRVPSDDRLRRAGTRELPEGAGRGLRPRGLLTFADQPLPRTPVEGRLRPALPQHPGWWPWLEALAGGPGWRLPHRVSLAKDGSLCCSMAAFTWHAEPLCFVL